MESSSKKLVLGMLLLAFGGLLLGGVIGYYGSRSYYQSTVLAKMQKEGYVNTALATATEDDIVEGKTAFSNGEIVSGTVVLFDTSDATATSDKILQGKTAYVNGQLVVGTIPSLPASDIMPTSEPSAISGGVYLTGDVVIQGDKNLVRGNIKKGVIIFRVTGSYDPAIERGNGDE